MHHTNQSIRPESPIHPGTETDGPSPCRKQPAPTTAFHNAHWMAMALACVWLGAGCQTQNVPDAALNSPAFQTSAGGASPSAFASADLMASAASSTSTNAMVLREGDTVRITFPGAPNLNTAQLIRRDGQITLPMGGELKAAGRTPAELEAELLKIFAPQLQFKEVVVSVDSSFFPVFVTGAVLRPGKIVSDRPITALEAIMEAGGFDYLKANLKAVVVVRQEQGQVRNFKLNLKLPLEGKPSEPFYLKPSDIVYVKERFSFF